MTLYPDRSPVSQLTWDVSLRNRGRLLCPRQMGKLTSLTRYYRAVFGELVQLPPNHMIFLRPLTIALYRVAGVNPIFVGVPYSYGQRYQGIGHYPALAILQHFNQP